MKYEHFKLMFWPHELLMHRGLLLCFKKRIGIINGTDRVMKYEHCALLRNIYFWGGSPVHPYISAEMVINVAIGSLFLSFPTKHFRGDFLQTRDCD